MHRSSATLIFLNLCTALTACDTTSLPGGGDSSARGGNSAVHTAGSSGAEVSSAGSAAQVPGAGGMSTTTMPVGGSASFTNTYAGATGAIAGNANGGVPSSSTSSATHGPGAAGSSAFPDQTGAAGSASTGNDIWRFFLPTGEPDNTAAPSIEIDAAGATHAIYPAYAGGDAYYGYCGPNCSGTDDVKVVKFATEGTVANAMIALTADGKPRVLLSAFQRVYYATCEADCTNASSWKQVILIEHQSDREVTGEALALNSAGQPRFLMHTYRAYLGIGQKAPETYLVQCDSNCDIAANWTSSLIANEIWEGSHLRFDQNDVAHLATTIRIADGERAGEKLSAYMECVSDCETPAGWTGIGLVTPYESEVEAVSVKPSVALALTRSGNPRVVVLAKTDTANKNLVYFECDQDCIHDNWSASIVSNHDQISAGFDLALDANDRPRLAYTLNYNIGLAFCDQSPCAGPNSSWDLTKVELGSEMPPDKIFLWENCTVAAWFLHNPSLALTSEGKPRVGYQARDISGGYSQPDPTKPRCVAGTDMTFSRLAVMSSHR